MLTNLQVHEPKVKVDMTKYVSFNPTLALRLTDNVGTLMFMCLSSITTLVIWTTISRHASGRRYPNLATLRFSFFECTFRSTKKPSDHWFPISSRWVQESLASAMARPVGPLFSRVASVAHILTLFSR